MKIADLCPDGHMRRHCVLVAVQVSECIDSMPLGQAAVVNEEGCTGDVRPECYACGYSAC